MELIQLEALSVKFNVNYIGASPAPCWIWRGKLTKQGRALFEYEWRGRSLGISAPRFAWMLHNRKTIPEFKQIHHECYEVLCVNPNHLFPLTEEENQIDYFEREELMGLEIELGERDPDSLKRLR